MNNQKLYFNSLDGLRTISFFIVFIAHGIDNQIVHEIDLNSYYLDSMIQALFNSGDQGVSVFFVISGFLITYLLLVEENKNGYINLKSFYIRRTLRIWPLYYAIVVYALFGYPLIAEIVGIFHESNSNIFLNLIFLNNFDLLYLGANEMVTFNPQIQITWSVAIEEQFYLIWPLLLILLKKKTYRKILFPSLLLINFFFRAYYNDDPFVNYFHSVAIMCDLVVGGWLAFLTFNNRNALKFFQNLNNKIRLIIYTLGIGILLSKFVIMDYIEWDFAHRYLLVAFFTFVVADQCFNKNSFLKLANLKLICRAGKYTYGLYLVHPICILLIKHIMDNVGFSYKTSWCDALILFVLSFMVTAIVSVLSYRYFESFFLRLKSRFTTI